MVKIIFPGGLWSVNMCINQSLERLKPVQFTLLVQSEASCIDVLFISYTLFLVFTLLLSIDTNSLKYFYLINLNFQRMSKKCRQR